VQLQRATRHLLLRHAALFLLHAALLLPMPLLYPADAHLYPAAAALPPCCMTISATAKLSGWGPRLVPETTLLNAMHAHRR
jgi:hypothetical protein